MGNLHTKSISEDPSKFSFTVHQYGHAIPTQVAAEALLNEGELLIKQVREKQWHNLETQLKHSNTVNASWFFTLSSAPPQGPSKSSEMILKDWNEPPTLDETFSLDELQEFENTDLSHLFVSQSQSRGVKRLHAGEKAEDGPRKLPRLDTESLQRVIPQPHTQLSKTLVTPDITKIKAYIRASPIFIPPYIAPLSSSPGDFSRRAWLIPARGSLPWKEASASTVLDSADSHLIGVTATESMIQWSRGGLVSFWNYLVRLKDLNTLGPLSLSFHPRKTLLLRKQKDKEKENSMLSRSGSSSSTADMSTSISQSQSSVDPQSSGFSTRSVLQDLDYFKVYHDAQISMHLRQALDLFAFVEAKEQSIISEGEEQVKPIRYRLLKGAKLVLVDERSKGILVA